MTDIWDKFVPEERTPELHPISYIYMYIISCQEL